MDSYISMDAKIVTAVAEMRQFFICKKKAFAIYQYIVKYTIVRYNIV